MDAKATGIDEMSVGAAIVHVMGNHLSRSKSRLDGIVTTAELLDRGVSEHQIRVLVARGDLVALDWGVYATAELLERTTGFPDLQVAVQATAALITASPGSVVSHHTAAQLHRLDLLERPPQLIAITRPPAAGSRSGKRSVHVHVARLPASHVSGRLGVPVTTVARTVIDLARSSEFRAGVVVADSALHQRLTSKEALRQVLAECQHIRGTRRAAEVVGFADDRAESALESIARVAFRDFSLPPPDLQVELGAPAFIARVDFLWKEFWTVAEVDGAMKYDDKQLAIRQLRRDARLREIGYEVVHFSWQDITRTPSQVAASVRAAFRLGTLRAKAAGPAA